MMSDIKPIPTKYAGYVFRSRLEARWAVFFDACRLKWEYEPQGFDLGNGVCYLPDFLLHGVQGRCGGDLWVEVKGQMTEEDAEKIWRFSGHGPANSDNAGRKLDTAILVVGNIPDCETFSEFFRFINEVSYADVKNCPPLFNFETIDGDYFAAYPGLNKNGGFELFGDDSSYLEDMDCGATLMAYLRARRARFEHGEKP